VGFSTSITSLSDKITRLTSVIGAQQSATSNADNPKVKRPSPNASRPATTGSHPGSSQLLQANDAIALDNSQSLQPSNEVYRQPPSPVKKKRRPGKHCENDNTMGEEEQKYADFANEDEDEYINRFESDDNILAISDAADADFDTTAMDTGESQFVADTTHQRSHATAEEFNQNAESLAEITADLESRYNNKTSRGGGSSP
jgi:hypothetical protein